MADFLSYTTLTEANRVVRRVCYDPTEGPSFPSFIYLSDTVSLPPYGSGDGYWFVFTLRYYYDSTVCDDTAYRIQTDSILIGRDPYLSIRNKSASATAHHLWPNPLQGDALHISSLAANHTIRITDPTGRSILFSRSSGTLYLPPSLPPGLYLLYIEGKDSRTILKFLKE